VGIEREAGGVAAIQDGQLARHDATGRTVLMNSRREETALEALTFALADLYSLGKIFSSIRFADNTSRKDFPSWRQVYKIGEQNGKGKLAVLDVPIVECLRLEASSFLFMP